MFTGLITDLGRVRSIERRRDTRITIETSYDMAVVPVGASIACSGACLTVVEKGQNWFAAEVSAETLARTTLGGWRADTPVNLERPLRIGDELGGHLVAGHVDGVAEIVARRPEGDSIRFSIRAPRPLLRFIAAKGSIALDGVSLTVNEVEDEVFGVNVISHTATVTTFGSAAVGDRVNLEIDMIARYVARLLPQCEAR